MPVGVNLPCFRVELASAPEYGALPSSVISRAKTCINLQQFASPRALTRLAVRVPALPAGCRVPCPVSLAKTIAQWYAGWVQRFPKERYSNSNGDQASAQLHPTPANVRARIGESFPTNCSASCLRPRFYRSAICLLIG